MNEKQIKMIKLFQQLSLRECLPAKQLANIFNSHKNNQ
ncbi:hypothetical protein Tsp_14909 [Trichinella spiralis]|nr:hypothetical protein Tsp_14909 [Trichinella spiralis]